MWIPKRIIYLISAPICFWSFIVFLISAVLTFDDTVLLGLNFYTSYLEFFPILLLCIAGCGAHIIIGLATFYQKDKQWRYQ